MGKKIMIVGANFGDKGSQAKLYHVIDELKKRYNDCEIYYAHNDETFDDSLYRFRKVLFTKKVQSQVLKANPLSNLTKMFRKKDDASTDNNDIVSIVSQLDLMIDVSEHTLVDTSSIQEIEYYMDNIKIAKKYKIPMIIMPQSFGPFKFSRDDMYILGELKDILFYPKMIYTREEDGFNEMMGYFGLDNIKKATDMLLTNNEFDLTNVLTRFYKPEVLTIPEGNNVAIVPNARCFGKKYHEHTMDMYKKIFEVLNATEKNVYIVCQNSADMDACKELATTFKNFSNVNLIDQELDCVEINMFMKNFEFIISSRYHGCVQAFRNFIPVLLLGTGVKYKELAQLLGQEKLCFDVLDENCNNFDIVDALVELIDDTDIAKTRVQTRMLNIQTKSCFNILDKLKW